MRDRALILEAHHTTHIEGTRLTLEQSERILAGEEVPGARPEDAREILNYKKAFELVSDYLEAGELITEALIREVHKRLVQGVRGNKAASGEYRRVQNYIVNERTTVTVTSCDKFLRQAVPDQSDKTLSQPSTFGLFSRG